jgi:TetR/AcrR family transcriptional regulator, transcriptional repressor for nem operon
MEDSKKRILDVALNLFLQKTYKEVSIQEITDQVGVTKGAFYYHFESKEQLFLQIVNQFSVITQMDFTTIESKSLYEFYHAYFSGFAIKKNKITDKIENDVNSYSLTFDALKLFPDFRKKVLQHEQFERTAWIKAIHNAKKSGEIKTKMADELIAEVFIYSADGIGMRSILQGKSKDVNDNILAFWDSFYSVLKG